jgi:hypothetical protein
MTKAPEPTEPISARTSISLPVDLAEFARSRASGNTSSYIAGLIAEDRRRLRVWERLAEHGYTGDKTPTDQGRERAREKLEQHRSRRKAGGEQAA